MVLGTLSMYVLKINICLGNQGAAAPVSYGRAIHVDLYFVAFRPKLYFTSHVCCWKVSSEVNYRKSRVLAFLLRWALVAKRGRLRASATRPES